MRGGCDHVRVLLAFDKFKGTLAAEEVSRVVTDALAAALPSADVRSVPLADGGGGTMRVALAHGFRPTTVAAADALGRPNRVVAGLAGRKAFLEMAAVCGLADVSVQDRNGMRATSVGLGLAARELLARGVDDITIALGGSASTDGGLGLLVGLGVAPVDMAGARCSPDLDGLMNVRALRIDAVEPRATTCRWTFLVDVDSPLLGPTGAAQCFGSQKGLTPTQIAQAEGALERWAGIVYEATGRNLATTAGAGAAGGIVVGASVLGSPTIRLGAEVVADLVGLNDHLAWADLVVTGEGRFDEQSTLGKGPGLVLRRAEALGVGTAVLAGSLRRESLPPDVSLAVSLTDVAGSRSRAEADPVHWLTVATNDMVRQGQVSGLLAGSSSG